LERTTVSLSPTGVLHCGMSVTGLCEICENATSDHACDLCGRQVCEKHFAKTDGVCTACAGDGGGGTRRPTDPDEMPDGVDTYEF
jgi:hypothetical protein